MKWEKLGRIFDPTEHKLPNNAKEFAQSPQTLIFEDFVRIFFSSREKDASGKYLSHICYADFDHDLKNVIRVCTEPVIPLGELGTFDEHGIFPVHICKDGDRVLAYTTGWTRRVSVSVDAAIGLAISEDNGRTFTKFGNGPVLTSSVHEPFLVADAFVLKVGAIYHMWYIYGLRWMKRTKDEPADRVYKIGHATSADGVSWAKENRQLISDVLNEDECQALPTIIYRNNTYHMVFCYRQAHGFRNDAGSAYRLGYAYSDDLINWTRDDSKVGIAPSDSGWDSAMMCYPHVFAHRDQVYLLYNGNEFGRHGFGLAILRD